MTTLTLSLPWPAHELSPNYHGPLRPFFQAKQQAHSDGYFLAREAMQGRGGWEFVQQQFKGHALQVAFTFHPPDRRSRDRDNAQASLKYQCDGIAQALNVDDNVFRLAYAWGDVRRGGCVEVTVAIAAGEEVAA